MKIIKYTSPYGKDINGDDEDMEGQTDLSAEIAGIELANPLMLASGIMDETGQSMASAVRHGAGSVVTKSLSMEPREGHQNPVVYEMDIGMINAMGLPNPGVEAYAEEIGSFREKAGDTPIFASIFGSSIEDYAYAASKAEELGVDGIEINGSCPNAKGLGLQFGQAPGVIGDLVSAVRSAVKIPVLFKLTPVTDDIVKLALAAQEGGAHALVAINTMKVIKLDIRTKRPVLTNGFGGLSGPALKPIGVRCVYEICSDDRIEIPVIGVGGISTAEDAIEYMMAGASAVQIGTAVRWQGPSIFGEISDGITKFMEEMGYSSIKKIIGAALEDGE